MGGVGPNCYPPPPYPNNLNKKRNQCFISPDRFPFASSQWPGKKVCYYDC